MNAAEVLWTPPADVRATTRVGSFLRWVEAERGLAFETYESLHRWSVDDLAGFWSAVAGWAGVELPGQVIASTEMPGARWFPAAAVSYAEHMLRLGDVDDDTVVILGRSQSRGDVDFTARELRQAVAACRSGLVSLGVGLGDRVAAYLPNIPETVVLLLATSSIGAIFTSCAPEFGTRSVVDRLRQVEPKVLVVVDGYRYGAKAIDRRAEVTAIRAELPSLVATIVVPYLDPGLDVAATFPGALSADAVFVHVDTDNVECVPVPFDHPLYILYSSGTTGAPKPIVHGHGGILLEHIKALALHCDLGPGQRFFWFSTTGWMMWNFCVSGLAVGAAIVCFDGDPGWPDLRTLWAVAADTKTTFFGASAPFLLACRGSSLHPAVDHDVSSIRAIGSTGAPLSADGFRWVTAELGGQVQLCSISGGTDVCSAFVGASPLVPVRAGVISCRCLGCAVEAFAPSGIALAAGAVGELVITKPMPSMPVGFWGDASGERFRAAYFHDFPGVWRHGDWIAFDADGGCVISGRSDATLNRGGVRLGTAELYAVIEDDPGVADSLVVHLEDPEGGAGRLVLFVVPAAGHAVDDALCARVASALRTQLSPRHVPDEMIEVPGIPKTLSGKKLEVPVKRILTGTSIAEAAALGAMANPEVLAVYAALAATVLRAR